MGNTIEWHRYNSTLVDRGKLTFWLADGLEEDWYCKKGGQRVYSDRSIEVLSMIRFKFGLTLRELEWFARSLFELAGLKLKIPCYSTLCRRLAGLELVFWQQIDSSTQLNVVVDSTGLKVFGEGEWKVRTHGYTKRRTWRKLHIAVDESNNKILAVALTTNDFKDNELLPALIQQIGPDLIVKIIGDGAYDDKKCFSLAEREAIEAIFPPKKGARICQHGNSGSPPKMRDYLIRGIRK